MKCNWTELRGEICNAKVGECFCENPCEPINVECKNTNTGIDKSNVNDRWFCIDKDNHMQEVINTRKIMHKNCINKEKLLKEMIKRNDEFNTKINISNNSDSIIYFTNRIIELEKWINKIENCEFDYE